MPYDTATLYLDLYTREMKTYTHKTWFLQAAFLLKDKSGNKCLSTDKCICPQELRAGLGTDAYTHIHCSIIHVSQRWKQPKYSSVD